MYIKSFLASWLRNWLQNNASWIIALRYGNFWNYREALVHTYGNNAMRAPKLYTEYLNRFNAFIGINTKIKQAPTLPHGLSGIFISNSAKIGKGVIIYHHVTIGSNTVEGSKGYGAPTIEDGVLIGAGAKIIGNLTIGTNSRIGAGCVITKSVPANSVVVMQPPRIIEKDTLKNDFLSNDGNLF